MKTSDIHKRYRKYLIYFLTHIIMKGREIPPQETSDGKKELYHGTKEIFDKFETPTGAEKMDVMEGGVVYFTSDIKTAKRYAGPNGYVCIAEVEDPVSYRQQREKQGLPPKQRRYTRNVYLALPVDVRIKEFKRASDIE
jgi:hypothetical protein